MEPIGVVIGRRLEDKSFLYTPVCRTLDADCGQLTRSDGLKFVYGFTRAPE